MARVEREEGNEGGRGRGERGEGEGEGEGGEVTEVEQ